MLPGQMPSGPSTPLTNRPLAPTVFGPSGPHPITPNVQVPPNATIIGQVPAQGMIRMGGPVRVPPPYCAQIFQLMGQRQYPMVDLFLAGCVFFFDETVQLLGKLIRGLGLKRAVNLKTKLFETSLF